MKKTTDDQVGMPGLY